MALYGCLIVGFRRPGEIVRVMDRVKDEGFDRVFISIDGTAGLAENYALQNSIVREVVKCYTYDNELSWDFIFRKNQYGIIKNFNDSIDQAFKEVDYLCILEDDCVPAFGLLDYFKNVVNLSDSIRIKMFTFFRPELQMISPGYFATHNPLMWGWGLSKSNWEEIRQGIAPTSKIKGLAKLRLLPFQSFYYSGYSRALFGESDALDALISYYFLMNDYLVIGPPVNLISNIGFGSLATHTREKSAFMETAASDWKSLNRDSNLYLGPYDVLRNDFAIARRMNNWKVHHIFSSYLKREVTKRFSRRYSQSRD